MVAVSSNGAFRIVRWRALYQRFQIRNVDVTQATGALSSRGHLGLSDEPGIRGGSDCTGLAGSSGPSTPTYRPSGFSSEYFRSTCAIASPTPVFHTIVPSSWTFGVGVMSLMPRHCSIISSIGVPRRR